MRARGWRGAWAQAGLSGAARFWRGEPRAPHLLAGVDGALRIGADVFTQLPEQEPLCVCFGGGGAKGTCLTAREACQRGLQTQMSTSNSSGPLDGHCGRACPPSPPPNAPTRTSTAPTAAAPKGSRSIPHKGAATDEQKASSPHTRITAPTHDSAHTRAPEQPRQQRPPQVQPLVGVVVPVVLPPPLQRHQQQPLDLRSGEGHLTGG